MIINGLMLIPLLWTIHPPCWSQLVGHHRSSQCYLQINSYVWHHDIVVPMYQCSYSYCFAIVLWICCFSNSHAVVRLRGRHKEKTLGFRSVLDSFAHKFQRVCATDWQIFFWEWLDVALVIVVLLINCNLLQLSNIDLKYDGNHRYTVHSALMSYQQTHLYFIWHTLTSHIVAQI